MSSKIGRITRIEMEKNIWILHGYLFLAHYQEIQNNKLLKQAETITN